jgi:hypothetical protein
MMTSLMNPGVRTLGPGPLQRWLRNLPWIATLLLAGLVRAQERPGLTTGLVLSIDRPRIEVAENRAYIPLFFILEGTPPGTNDVTVRARFVEGTAKPGEDFDFSQPTKAFPASIAGIVGLNWIPLPLIQDETNEGTETAVFELAIDGETNAPVRVEVMLLDDLEVGEVGFVSTRFQINEGSTNGYAQVRLWRTLNTRDAATVSFRVEGAPEAVAVLGGESRRSATFAPGESQIFVQIPLVNDAVAQGVREATLVLETEGSPLKPMAGLTTAVVTVADDETPGVVAPIRISEYEAEDGQRGVMVSTAVPRGYQVRLEYSDAGVAGPWQLSRLIEGADVERFAFDSYEASAMRVYRLGPAEPLDYTFPW